VHLKQTLASAIRRLTADQVPSPRLNAELLLMFTLSCDRAYPIGFSSVLPRVPCVEMVSCT
jgi:hypothetical protein